MAAARRHIDDSSLVAYASSMIGITWPGGWGPTWSGLLPSSPLAFLAFAIDRIVHWSGRASNVVQTAPPPRHLSPLLLPCHWAVSAGPATLAPRRLHRHGSALCLAAAE